VQQASHFPTPFLVAITDQEAVVASPTICGAQRTAHLPHEKIWDKAWTEDLDAS
jgi:hypothetical protein